jgi:cytochrome c oxidase subunit II
MPFQLRPRWPATRGAGTAALTVALLALSACSRTYPESVFHGRTDFNRDVNSLFSLIIILGVIVFVFVEGLLLWTMWKYRTQPGQREPEHVHGNTTLEIAWTIIPALILVVIAVPTVRTIFKTQAPVAPGSLHVEVIGHQWWWEFRYPELGIVTANELYLPHGKTVGFDLKTQDVIHSFWVPALGGKRDLIANHVNHIWFTPDSTNEKAFNGVCVEYCGASHANMRFRTYVVSQEEFDSWAAHQKTAAIIPGARAGPATGTSGAATAPTNAPNGLPATLPAGASVSPTSKQANIGTNRAGPQAPSTGPRTAVAGGTAPSTTPVAQTGYSFPAGDMPKNVASFANIPAGLTYDENLLAGGDAARGADLMLKQMAGGCIGCHAINGTVMTATMAPNLTHVGSRNTIAAGLFPNDPKHLALWIKNARLMKPGVAMFTLGKGQIDPQTKKVSPAGTLTDQQIADIVAFLRSLK